MKDESYSSASLNRRRRRQPLGRTEELLEKEEEQAARRANEAVYYGSAYGTKRLSQASPQRSSHRRKEKHSLLWLFVLLLCLAALAALALLLGPQLLGIRYAALPNLAFAGGRVIRLDENALQAQQELAARMYGSAILPGVTIDGVDVGGMTLQQAERAVEQTEAQGGGEFAVTVDINGSMWLIDSSQVPLTRDTAAVLNAAWSYGRSNSADIRGGGLTPLAERGQRADTLALNGAQLTTRLSYDQTLIRALTDQIAERFTAAPIDASVAAFDLNTKRFVFNDDTPGLYLDADRLYSAVLQQLNSGNPYGTVAMEPELVVAGMTKAELMNLLRRISSYTTGTTSNNNRNNNIRLSAEAINGVVVEPGETFSFNRATGERTEEKGYREATAISGGQSLPEIGGGVCQTSSTLFNAVARANLPIVSRSPHAWPSSYVEKGMDATVNWPGLDFQFKNDTDWPVYIVAWYEDRKVTVELYGKSLGDGISIDLESRVVQTLDAPKGVKEEQNPALPRGTRKTTVKARKGYVVETWQVWKRGGVEYERKLLCTSRYNAYQETVEYN